MCFFTGNTATTNWGVWLIGLFSFILGFSSHAGVILAEGQCQRQGDFNLCMQRDGNLVIYHDQVGAVWATGTTARTEEYVTLNMQDDGNLVIYADTQPLWASNTVGWGKRVSFQRDGNLVVYNADNLPVWARFGMTPKKNYTQQIFSGYQGWLSHPEGSQMNQWFHWKCKDKNNKDALAVDMLPDVSEFPKEALYGGKSYFYDSAHPGVIDTHFKWLKKYGLDGLAVQRFLVTAISNVQRNHTNTVLANVAQSALKHQKSFYVMYDLTGSKQADWKETFLNDLAELKAKHYFTHPYYVRQGGRPVVAIWGPGFKTRDYLKKVNVLSLIQELKNRGFFVVGGVPYHWAEPNGGDDAIQGYDDVFAAYDGIIPWGVGRYDSVAAVRNRFEDQITRDLGITQQRGQTYNPVIFPGFSWRNLKSACGFRSDDNAAANPPYNAIPRQAGLLIWEQAKIALKHGIAPYVAMFDEYDEATAIAKALPKQRGNNSFSRPMLTLDFDGYDLPSDYYLKVVGQITAMFGNGGLLGSVPGNMPPVQNSMIFYRGQLQLKKNQHCNTPNMQLLLQGDGNLPIYRKQNGRLNYADVLWATNRLSADPELYFQSDGNLVIYSLGTPIWASNTGGLGDRLQIGPDKVSIRNTQNKLLWQSK